MKARWFLVLLIAGSVARADADQDLQFAQRLGARGFEVMAKRVLQGLVDSSDPAAQRAGKYGMALLRKQEATILRLRFLRALEEGNTPPVTREKVLAAYEAAVPDIEDYVSKASADNLDPYFLLAEMLQEYAEFLAGASYPEGMNAVTDKLAEENRDKAEQLFNKAIENYEKVYKPYREGKKVLPTDPSDPIYGRVANAELQAGIAKFRLAQIYGTGPNFTYRTDEAIEMMDDFLQRHYEELVGGYAMLYIGQCFFEKAIRKGDEDAGETALAYFETLYNEIEEVPSAPGTVDVIARAFYWYTRAANAIAAGEGALKKPRPIYYDNAVASGAKLLDKLSAEGQKNPWAMRARLNVAAAHATREEYEEAVAIAGQVLASARVEGQGDVARLATDRLTDWVAHVSGAGALDTSLLFQIGESLLSQQRYANAITFFEKAIASAHGDEEIEKYGYPSRLRVARAYRSDGRQFAAGRVAWKVVQDYLKTGLDEDTALGQVASECCNIARLAWKTISEATKRPADETQYQTVLQTFREKFPGHPENSDQEFKAAREAYERKQFEAAAEKFGGIPQTSPNYWSAQRLVPICYRNLAVTTEDEAQKKGWFEKCLAAAQELAKKAAADPSAPGAERAAQYGMLYEAIADAELKRWDDALRVVDAYMGKYPGQFLQYGLEYDIKIHAHLARGELESAEAALSRFKEKLPNSSYLGRSNYDVFDALRTKFKALPEGDAQREQLAKRAARLWEYRVEQMESPDAGTLFYLGDTLEAAHEHAAAAEAYQAAADNESDANRKRLYTLRAARANYDATEEGNLPESEKLKIREAARKQFTDVLIPNKQRQEEVLKVLADPNAWPSNEQWGLIQRFPDELYTAARIFRVSSPPGLDGRWIAWRLMDHLHTFIDPIPDPNKPKMAEYVPLWWDAAELKMRLAKEIADSGGPSSKAAASKGLAFGKKILFISGDKADGPERAREIEDIVKDLERRN